MPRPGRAGDSLPADPTSLNSSEQAGDHQMGMRIEHGLNSFVASATADETTPYRSIVLAGRAQLRLLA